MESNCSSRRLTTELIVEILSRLPIKSIVRFKCVCKSWSFIISHPSFAKLHFRQSLTASSHRLLYMPRHGSKPRSIDMDALLCQDPAVPPSPNLNYLSPSERSPIKLRGSCRGFVLLDDRCSQNLILWNPSTGAHKTVPYPPNTSRYRHGSSFGYDMAADDYLVVMTSLRISRADTVFYLETFSVRTNSWEEIQLQHAPFPNVCAFLNICEKCGLFFNGVIHWIVYGSIICFDLRLRKFSAMDVPDGFCCESIAHLMVVRGCLAVCNRFEIWVMEKYKVQSSWTKYCDVYSRLHVLCFNKDGEMIGLTTPGSTTSSSDGVKLVKHNDKGEQLESRDFCDMYGFGRAIYRESLFSLPSE